MRQVFLSSTGMEMGKFREAVYAAISGLDGFHCVRMEDFGARLETPIEVCRRAVKRCEIFVGILGHDYGSKPEGLDKSFTELEFAFAEEFNKQTFMFLSADELASEISPSARDADKQRKFRERILARKTIARFTTPEQLALNVVQALQHLPPEVANGAWKRAFRLLVYSSLLFLVLRLFMFFLMLRVVGTDDKMTPGEYVVLFAIALGFVCGAFAAKQFWKKRRSKIVNSPGRHSSSTALGLCLFTFALGARPANAAVEIGCVADRPTVEFGKDVAVRVWSDRISGPSSLHWEWDGGELSIADSTARWTAPPEEKTFTVRVRVTDARGENAQCALQLMARKPGASTGKGRETVRQWLIAKEPEDGGYGLHSYVLFGGAPSSALKERYLAAIDAYLQVIPEIRRLEEYFEPNVLNVTRIPVTRKPPDEVSKEWVLQQYDYGRARSILNRVDPSLRTGPYLLSLESPVESATGDVKSRALLQDLSWVPPHLMEEWIRAFMNQAAQQKFREPNRIVQFGLGLRTLIGLLASAFPSVPGSAVSAREQAQASIRIGQ